MKVILKTDVTHLGRAGQILKVKNGYARNFLFPRKLALPAAAGSLKEAQHKQKIAKSKAAKAQLLRNEIASQLEGLSLSFQQPASSSDKLFGSITAQTITAALQEKGFSIDKKFILLEAPIKQIGDYNIEISLGTEKSIHIKVSVLKENKDKTDSILSKVVSKVVKKVTSELIKKDGDSSKESPVK